jgi:hypothetical protein
MHDTPCIEWLITPPPPPPPGTPSLLVPIPVIPHYSPNSQHGDWLIIGNSTSPTATVALPQHCLGAERPARQGLALPSASAACRGQLTVAPSTPQATTWCSSCCAESSSDGCEEQQHRHAAEATINGEQPGLQQATRLSQTHQACVHTPLQLGVLHTNPFCGRWGAETTHLDAFHTPGSHSKAALLQLLHTLRR